MVNKKRTESDHMEKIGWVLVMMAVTIFLGLYAVNLKLRKEVLMEAVSKTRKPPIEELFACGDYCPGPKEKYMVKVYAGVTDEKTCAETGGDWRYFVGWGKTYFCGVK